LQRKEGEREKKLEEKEQARKRKGGEESTP
jgi:hypothetical protein